MRPLVWFRSDLRMADNPALYHACKTADEGVVGVFAVCPKQWQAHDWGTMKVDFLLRNLGALSRKLAKFHIPLKIVNTPRFDSVPSVLHKLAKTTGCDAIYFNNEFEVNEKRRDESVATYFEKKDLLVERFEDHCVIHPDRIATGDGQPYKVFTPFFKKWRDTLDREHDLRTLPAPRAQKPTGVLPDEVPSKIIGFDGETREDLWPAGEIEAWRRLKVFIEQRIRHYQKNRDYPAVNGTSVISPYLAGGVISIRQCLAAAVLANHGHLRGEFKGVDTWIGELVWREFYRHVLYAFPHVCMNRAFKKETDRIEWRHDEKLFAAWCEGRTGVPIVDAAMRQLVRTGWMHNRLRMISAMYLTKDLFIDWRWGERFFMRHLVDGDFANNNGGWQWSASTGTDAAPYFRIFNPVAQSKRFDPNGAFIRKFLPVLAPLSNRRIHDPYAGKQTADIDYPRPIADHKKAREHAIATFKDL